MIVLLSDGKLSEKPRARFACWLSRSCGFFVNGLQVADLRIPLSEGPLQTATMKTNACVFALTAFLATGEVRWQHAPFCFLKYHICISI